LTARFSPDTVALLPLLRPEIPMKSYRKCPPATFVIANRICRRTGLALLPAVFLALHPASSALGQSRSVPPAQSPTQSQPQSQATTQTISGDKPQTLGDAARQANAQKNKTKAKRVYSEDDLSGIHGTISVVGGRSPSRSSAGNGNPRNVSNEEDVSPSGNNSEAYWRGRAQAIKDQIASVDQQITQVKAEIARSGPTSFDPSTGLTQNVIIIHDRNAQLKDLEERKRSFEKQLDALADEARKAGADSGWTR
jgi:septal ring factor EnvC (AmiA/AmiB activator)